MPNTHPLTTGTAPEAVPEASIIIVGRTNSGKTTAGHFLQQYSDSGTHIEASSILSDILESRDQSMTPKNIREYMKETNMNGVARDIVPNIETSTGTAFVTGVRSPSEIEYIRDNIQNTFIVGIRASESVRLERAIVNSEASNSTAKDQFKMKEKLDNDLGITTTINEYSEYEIYNHNSIAIFHDKLRTLYDRVVSEQSVLRNESYPVQ